MTKKELNQAISKELTKVKNELELLQKIKKIDLSKFEGKQISKRIETHLKKELGENYYISLTYDLYYDYKLYISYMEKNEHNYYNERVKIDITVYKTNEPVKLFRYSELEKQIDQWINNHEKTIEKLTNELENIDQMIKLYNDLIAIESKCGKELSYIFKDSVSFYNYAWRRTIEE